MSATKQQKADIRRNCKYNVAIKEEYVQWATNDNSKISLNDLSYDQAEMILAKQVGKEYIPENWAAFDKNNKKHRTVLSLCIQMGLSVDSERYGKVADLKALNEWLHSKLCPAQKPLMKMDATDLKRVIGALSAMVKKKYK